MLKVRVGYLEKMDHEVEYNEYLFKNMKNITTTTTTTSFTTNNNNKKRWSKLRGVRSKRRGLYLRVKLKRFWVRATIAHWFKLRLRCLRHALKSLVFNISTITSRRSKTKTKTSSNSTSNNSTNHYNHNQYSYVRSNSFYAEAIAECLEFIKRSSSNHHHHHQSHKLLL